MCTECRELVLAALPHSTVGVGRSSRREKREERRMMSLTYAFVGVSIAAFALGCAMHSHVGRGRAGCSLEAARTSMTGGFIRGRLNDSPAPQHRRGTAPLGASWHREGESSGSRCPLAERTGRPGMEGEEPLDALPELVSPLARGGHVDGALLGGRPIQRREEDGFGQGFVGFHVGSRCRAGLARMSRVSPRQHSVPQVTSSSVGSVPQSSGPGAGAPVLRGRGGSRCGPRR